MATMEAISRCVSGLAVHKKTVVACRRRVPDGGQGEKAGKTFGTTTASLLAWLAWLGEWQLTRVALESTGVYWQPVWNIREGQGALLLVNARHLKTVPGRQTAVKDGEWSAPLLHYGLLRASVVPSPQVRQWRDFPRHRTQRIEQHTSVVNRRHKVLEDANSKLSTGLSDLRGVSGRRLLRALAAGESAPAVLGAMGDKRLQATPEARHESLRGKVHEHHRCMWETLRDQVDLLEQPLPRLDERIEAQMGPFAAAIHRLATIDGLDRRGAQNL